MKFKEWLKVKEMLSPVPFPSITNFSPDVGKELKQLTAFPTGEAKMSARRKRVLKRVKMMIGDNNMLTHYSNLMLENKLNQLSSLDNLIETLIDVAIENDIAIPVLNELSIPHADPETLDALHLKYRNYLKSIADKERPIPKDVPPKEEIPNDMFSMANLLRKLVTALSVKHHLTDEQINKYISDTLNKLKPVKPDYSRTINTLKKLNPVKDTDNQTFNYNNVAQTQTYDNQTAKDLGFGNWETGEPQKEEPKDDPKIEDWYRKNIKKFDKLSSEDKIKHINKMKLSPEQKQKLIKIYAGDPDWYNEMSTKEKEHYDSLTPDQKQLLINKHKNPTNRKLTPSEINTFNRIKVKYPELTDKEIKAKVIKLYARHNARRRTDRELKKKGKTRLPNFHHLLNNESEENLGNIFNEWTHLAGI